MRSAVLLLHIVYIVSGFLPSTNTKNGLQIRTQNLNLYPDDRTPRKDDEYEGNVDWDAEWKKVVSEKDKPIKRPKGLYKSDAEIAVTKVVNKATQKMVDVSKNVQIPNIRIEGSLTSDWRFWIGILVLFSVITSLLSAPPQMGVQDSYYI
mmetsp:Transcript_33353/g.37934  ORF Transcript_33353/g.37934 Transcript_33353/m.37934 type:complete len:150 (-) Transcript_33353:259-708(-)